MKAKGHVEADPYVTITLPFKGSFRVPLMFLLTARQDAREGVLHDRRRSKKTVLGEDTRVQAMVMGFAAHTEGFDDGE